MDLIIVFLVSSFVSPFLLSFSLVLKALFKTRSNEKTISNLVQLGFGAYLLSVLGLDIAWLLSEEESYHYFGLYVDLQGIVFVSLIAILSNVIIHYSRRYMHRDPGYRKFFMILSFFVLGMNLIATSGSFNLLFAGWEVVGISSYLLIGYYWHRPRAIENANRAYFIYRFCDIGLLLAALIAHLIWHDQAMFHEHWEKVPIFEQWLLCLAILLPALGKSAQFPFSFWFPRAMEGPTPSSAIFYGSLSIHSGLFLMMRTYPIWQKTLYFSVLVGALGLITFISSSMFARIQSNIKGQIGYASIAQVGLMFVELALGCPNLALAHLVFNSLLRCFQLLISPSIVADQLHIHHALEGRLIRPFSLRHESLYVFSINEGFFEAIILKIIAPFHLIFNQLRTMAPKSILHSIALINFLVVAFLWPDIDLFFILGFCASWLFSLYILNYILSFDKVDLSQFPIASSLCLIGFLGMSGFPLSVSFLGEEHLNEIAFHHGYGFLLLQVFVFVLNGIVLVDLYSRVFCGVRGDYIYQKNDFSPHFAAILLLIYFTANWLPWILWS